jgi:prepilin-type N-terminal cleavage/methylation domain-containing protein
MSRRRAFTLIEVVACVALLVILCMIAGVSLRGRQRAAGMDLAVEQIRFADAQARERARRTGREVHLRFDLERGGEVLLESSDGAERIALPDGCRATRAYSAGRATRGREISITCSGAGYTPSYAVLVETEGNERQQRWILFAGLTGAMRTVADERTVDEILFGTAMSAAQVVRDDPR